MALKRIEHLEASECGCNKHASKRRWKMLAIVGVIGVTALGAINAPNASIVRAATSLVGDINGDGTVGAQDLSLLLSNWGKTSTGTPAPTSTPTPVVTTTAPTGNVLNVLDYGAKGDGRTDDTAALQKALDDANGRIVYIPAGRVFPHKDVLRLKKDGTHLSGPGTLLSTDPSYATVWVQANNVIIDGGLIVKAGNLNGRKSAPWNNGITLDGFEYGKFSGATVKNVTIDGSSSAGLLVYGHTNYLIQDVTIQNTLADALHQTHGASNGRVIRPIIKNAADDGVAVISYKQDGAICKNITIESPRFYGSTNGRAFSVVGGEDITWTDVYAENSDAAAIYVGAESSYNTYPIKRVSFTGGTLVNSNTSKEPDHGSIFLLSGQSGVNQEDVTIKGITVKNSSPLHDQIRAVVYGGGFVRTVLRDITIVGGSTSIYSGNYSGNGLNRINWTNNGAPVPDVIKY